MRLQKMEEVASEESGSSIGNSARPPWAVKHAPLEDGGSRFRRKQKLYQ